MHEYQVLARKYRPKLFADVVAQGPVVATLKNAIKMGRTAHAYLFCGTRGTGKTTLARLFAKALNCSGPSEDLEPCGTCPSCRDITAGNAIDVLEIDGASHRGIEDVRQINETIAFMPTAGRYKIYLIDEVHMLTKEAFNALLKTLEEPPSHVKFFFCTTEPHKIPATILSRCQRFNLRRIPIEKIEQKLAQITAEVGIDADQGALNLIAERAEGSLRDALSILDQIIAFEMGTITARHVGEVLGLPPKEICFALDEAGLRHDVSAAFKITSEVLAAGHNLSHFLEELISHFRTLLQVKCGHTPADPRYIKQGAHYRIHQLAEILEILTDGQQSLKSAPSERTALEMILLKIVRTHRQLSLDELVQRLIDMEKRFTTSEDPTPKLQDLPKPKVAAAPVKNPPPKPAAPPPHTPPSVQEQSRFDTVMRFAAKELNGTIKKETPHG